jgi:Protein of unknown function (DUF3263)
MVVFPELLPPATPMMNGRGGADSDTIRDHTVCGEMWWGACNRPGPAANLSRMLSERSAAMLDFERAWWNIDEPRDQVIRARFQCSPDEYHAELTTVLDDPAAMDHDPLVVRRLKRLRLRARRARLDGSASQRAAEGAQG